MRSRCRERYCLKIQCKGMEEDIFTSTCDLHRHACTSTNTHSLSRGQGRELPHRTHWVLSCQWSHHSHCICVCSQCSTHVFCLIHFISSLPHNFIVIDHKAANRNFNIFQSFFGLKHKVGNLRDDVQCSENYR